MVIVMIDQATGETRRPRVLVVQDDRGFALSLLFALEPYADVCVVTSGGAALARLGAGEQYDGLVCDHHLPDLTGAQLHDEVRTHHPTHADRVLLTSAGPGSADRTAARLLAAIHVPA